MLERLGTLVAVLVAAGCTVPPLDLEGHACPCLDGYQCVQGTCVKGSTFEPDAGAAADAGEPPCEFLDEQPCGTDEGECKAGEKTCDIDGVWGDCVGAVGPAAFDECDGKDNDCNGQTDEGGAGACEKILGVCVGARRDCVGGTPETTCPPTRYGVDYQAGDEAACDGKDNDCDGETDEGIVGSACEKTRGVCAGAKRRCVAGKLETTCADQDYGADFEAVEATCDGKDNDCDGETDVGAPPSGACEKQSGVCAGAERACVQGAFETPCTARSYPSQYSTAELCDGLDNDCNGQTDETFTCAKGSTDGTSCTSGCGTPGLKTCKDTCNGYECAPPPEACNGIDDDCDQATDEDLNPGFLSLTPNEATTSPAVARWTGAAKGFLVAWLRQQAAPAPSEVHLQFVDPLGTKASAAVAVAGSSTAAAPAIAGPYVGWAATGKVRAAQLAADGAVGAAFDVGAGDAPGLVGAALTPPAFAWVSSIGVAVARVTNNVADVKTALGSGLAGPAFASAHGSGKDVLVSASATNLQVADLTQPGPAFTEHPVAQQRIVAVAAAGSLVAMQQTGSCAPCPPGRTESSVIALVGIVGATSGPTSQTTVTDAAAVYATAPRVAWLGGSDYVVAWVGSGTGPATMSTRRVTFDGSAVTLGSSMGLTLDPSSVVSVAVASDGLLYGYVLEGLEAAGGRFLRYRTTCPP